MKIGIIGGFGGFATVEFFHRLLERFQTNNEGSYPHIIMDNNFQMPSRTKALLSGEGFDVIVEKMVESMELMLRERVDYIILPCGTAHVFLPKVYEQVPKAEAKVLNIVKLLGLGMQKQGGKVLVMAAEGTLKYRLYSNILHEYGVECIEPQQKQWAQIRYFIEMVKQNDYPAGYADELITFINQYKTRNVILGCTEFPVLFSKAMQEDRRIDSYNLFDPLENVLDELKRLELLV